MTALFNSFFLNIKRKSITILENIRINIVLRIERTLNRYDVVSKKEIDHLNQSLSRLAFKIDHLSHKTGQNDIKFDRRRKDRRCNTSQLQLHSHSPSQSPSQPKPYDMKILLKNLEASTESPFLKIIEKRALERRGKSLID